MFRFGPGIHLRILDIDSVSLKDGNWVVQGRYGIPGKGLGRVNIDITDSGKQPAIRFLSGAYSTINLRLLGQEHLIGGIRIPGGTDAGLRGGGNESTMPLERVE
jgi:hypothetical protein